MVSTLLFAQGMSLIAESGKKLPLAEESGKKLALAALFGRVANAHAFGGPGLPLLLLLGLFFGRFSGVFLGINSFFYRDFGLFGAPLVLAALGPGISVAPLFKKSGLSTQRKGL